MAIHKAVIEKHTNLEMYFCVRCIKTSKAGTKTCIAEFEYDTEMPVDEFNNKVAKHLIETGADFVSVVTNFRVLGSNNVKPDPVVDEGYME